MTTFLSRTNTHKHTQLEEANRTLTNDVANLAYEKEELNNKLKDLMEGERPRIHLKPKAHARVRTDAR